MPARSSGNSACARKQRMPKRSPQRWRLLLYNVQLTGDNFIVGVSVMQDHNDPKQRTGYNPVARPLKRLSNCMSHHH